MSYCHDAVLLMLHMMSTSKVTLKIAFCGSVDMGITGQDNILESKAEGLIFMVDCIAW